MVLADKDITSFRNFIWEFYRVQGRTFPWRNVDDPYKVVVSEIMLQQTQTYRVESKYERFIAAFPTWDFLAQASLRDVLTLWQGLGYNRRGMALHKIAQKVMQEYNGTLPHNPQTLEAFPGIGKATAGSICAFAFNAPTVFIETNIRAVFIHTFFKNKSEVHDKELFPLVEQTLDLRNPREWYYALMDYGVHLKKLHKNPSQKSAHHTKQSKFEGSDRQIRGAVLRILTEKPLVDKQAMLKSLAVQTDRAEKILKDLCAEGLVKITGNQFFIG